MMDYDPEVAHAFVLSNKAAEKIARSSVALLRLDVEEQAPREVNDVEVNFSTE
jgi:hypothetical protein